MTAPQDPFSKQPQGEPGTPPAGPPAGYGVPPHGQSQGTNGLAIASLVTAFFCSPVAIILGFIAKGQIKQSGQSGSGLATAGIVIGGISLLLGVLLFLGGALA